MTKFWSDIWSEEVKYRNTAAWLEKVEEEVSGTRTLANPEVSKNELVKVIKQTHSWEAPGPDKIHNYWFKKFISIHDQLLNAINRCLQKADLIISSLTNRITYMLPKREIIKIQPYTGQ